MQRKHQRLLWLMAFVLSAMLAAARLAKARLDSSAATPAVRFPMPCSALPWPRRFVRTGCGDFAAQPAMRLNSQCASQYFACSSWPTRISRFPA